VAETAEKAGCLAGAGLVVILALALTAYGATQFQQDAPTLGVKTLSGREVARDPLQVPALRAAHMHAPSRGATRKVLLSQRVCRTASMQLLCRTCTVGLWCGLCPGLLSRGCSFRLRARCGGCWSERSRQCCADHWGAHSMKACWLAEVGRCVSAGSPRLAALLASLERHHAETARCARSPRAASSSLRPGGPSAAWPASPGATF